MTTIVSEAAAPRVSGWLLVYMLAKTLLIVGLVLLFRSDVEQNVIYMAF